VGVERFDLRVGKEEFSKIGQCNDAALEAQGADKRKWTQEMFEVKMGSMDGKRPHFGGREIA